jgi:hypothetical protein
MPRASSIMPDARGMPRVGTRMGERSRSEWRLFSVAFLGPLLPRRCPSRCDAAKRPTGADRRRIHVACRTASRSGEHQRPSSFEGRSWPSYLSFPPIGRRGRACRRAFGAESADVDPHSRHGRNMRNMSELGKSLLLQAYMHAECKAPELAARSHHRRQSYDPLGPSQAPTRTAIPPAYIYTLP